jgi:hypothetical protein
MLIRAWIAACAAALAVSSATESKASPPQDPVSAPATRSGCLVAGDGYLRARLRGALDLDLDWKDAQMQCDGGPRPSGNGVRVSIGGPARGEGRRIRIVFGIGGISEGTGGKALRTNVTILFEGEQRVYATLGDDKCTVDSLTQRRVETLGADQAVYRIEARGFCLGPATSLSRDERILVTSFDFAGRVEFSDDDRHDLAPKIP